GGVHWGGELARAGGVFLGPGGGEYRAGRDGSCLQPRNWLRDDRQSLFRGEHSAAVRRGSSADICDWRSAGGRAGRRVPLADDASVEESAEDSRIIRQDAKVVARL